MGPLPAVVAALAVLAGVVVSSAVVWRASSAAFTTQAQNTGNALTALQLQLTDNDSGTALFSVTGMRPGPTHAVSRCIKLTYTGASTNITAVKMFAAATTSTLAPYLTMAVDVAPTGDLADCSDFGTPSAVSSTTLTDFLTNRTSFANGATVWTPSSASESRTVRVTMTLADDNAAQGLVADGLAFTWEAQSAA